MLYCKIWCVFIRFLWAVLHLIITNWDVVSSLVKLQYVCALSHAVCCTGGKWSVKVLKKKCLQFIYCLLKKSFSYQQTENNPSLFPTGDTLLIFRTASDVSVTDVILQCCIISECVMPSICCIFFLSLWKSRTSLWVKNQKQEHEKIEKERN